jgi:molecular chaperone GrpE
VYEALPVLSFFSHAAEKQRVCGYSTPSAPEKPTALRHAAEQTKQKESDSMANLLVRLRALLPRESLLQLPAAGSSEAVRQRLRTLEQELSQVQEKLRRTEAEFAEYRADFARYKRRTEQQAEKVRAEEGATIFSYLLPVFENFLRIYYAIPPEQAGQPWGRAVQSTIKELSATFKRLGVHRFGKVGEVFNPEWHEAVAVESCPGKPGGIVLRIVQLGYFRGERMLRRAQVIVSS